MKILIEKLIKDLQNKELIVKDNNHPSGMVLLSDAIDTIWEVEKILSAPLNEKQIYY